MPLTASLAFFRGNMTAGTLYSMMDKNGKSPEQQRAEFGSFAQRSITKLVRSVIRGERKQVDQLLRDLRAGLTTDLDRMMQELRSRSLQTESSLAAKLDDIDASLSLIARELARRADDPPSARQTRR